MQIDYIERIANSRQRWMGYLQDGDVAFIGSHKEVYDDLIKLIEEKQLEFNWDETFTIWNGVLSGWYYKLTDGRILWFRMCHAVAESIQMFKDWGCTVHIHE